MTAYRLRLQGGTMKRRATWHFRSRQRAEFAERCLTRCGCTVEPVTPVTYRLGMTLRDDPSFVERLRVVPSAPVAPLTQRRLH